MPHVVPADDVGAVREPARMRIVRRAQQQRRGVDGARRNHDHVAGDRDLFPIALDDDPRHLAARRSGLEPHHLGAGPELDVRMPQRRLDRADLRVRLAAHETGKAVAGAAADAGAPPPVALVELHRQRHRERPQTLRREVLGKLLDAWLVAHRRMRVRRAAPGLGGIDPRFAVHLI